MKKLITILLLSVVSYSAFSQAYCQPSGGFGACSLGLNDFWITDVSFTGTGSTFAFTGGACVANAPYYLYTAYQGDVVAGNTYTLTVGRAGNTYLTKFNVWVDWDTNSVLNDVTPFVENIAANLSLAAGGGLTSTATVTIPAGVTPGIHRMRVRIQYNANNANNPCLTTGQAESKDFDLNVVAGSVGINENSNANGITISPNPFTSQTTITFEEEQKNTSIKIMNLLGECIQQQTINSKQINIDMSNDAKGIYFYKIINTKGDLMEGKLMVE